MKNHKGASKEEQNDLLEIEQIYQEKIQLIIILRKICNLTQRKASEVVKLDVSSICRYENNNQVMSTAHYIQIHFYYMKHIEINQIILSNATLLLIEQFSDFQKSRIISP